MSENNTDEAITLDNSASEAQDTPPPEYSSGLLGLTPMIFVFFIFYFLILRPQEKKRREQEEMVGGAKKGEKVMTNSGIFGIITEINNSDNTIKLKVSDNTEIEMLKSSITNIIEKKSKNKDLKNSEQKIIKKKAKKK